MRVVFDTNVLVSAVVFPGGMGDRALGRILRGEDVLLFSKEILDELLGVLARKFDRNREELARVAVFVDSIAERIDPRTRLDVLADEPDNRILECATFGRAEAVVTGDRAMLALGSFESTRILSLRRYLVETKAG